MVQLANKVEHWIELDDDGASSTESSSTTSNGLGRKRKLKGRHGMHEIISGGPHNRRRIP
jgi:hypothetical protein